MLKIDFKKKFGRTKINRLDWLLAIVACIISVAALWLSLGLSIVDGGPSSVYAFKTFLAGLGFAYGIIDGGSIAIAIASTVVIYGALGVLGYGIYYLYKKDAKDRIPGLVAGFLAALGFTFNLGVSYEYTLGHASNAINGFWPYSLIFFIFILFALMGISFFMAYNVKIDISLDEIEEDDGDEEETPVYEEIIDEDESTNEEIVDDDENEGSSPTIDEEEAESEVEKADEEKTEVDEELTEEEEAEDEDIEDDESDEEEADEENDDNPYTKMGPRRKRVPFENKIKHANPVIRERYKLIVSALRKYDFNDRKSVPCETFSYKKVKMIVLTFSGRTLKAYFRLNPVEYEGTTIPVKDASDLKKYVDTPTCLIIKSDLAARRAVMLAERIIAERKIPKL